MSQEQSVQDKGKFMRVEKINQQTFGHRYTINSINMDPGDFWKLTNVFKYSFKKSDIRPDMQANRFLVSTDKDVVEVLKIRSRGEYLTDFFRGASELTSEQVKNMYEKLLIIQKGGIFNFFKIRNAEKSIKETLKA